MVVVVLQDANLLIDQIVSNLQLLNFGVWERAEAISRQGHGKRGQVIYVSLGRSKASITSSQLPLPRTPATSSSRYPLMLLTRGTVAWRVRAARLCLTGAAVTLRLESI